MLLPKIQSIVAAGCLAALVITQIALPADAFKPTGNSGSAKPTTETRFVQFEEATLHCGPAKEYYVTSVLQRGVSVEVYHQTKDGWCGVRPPDGSHDWLAADQAYLLPGGKQAEVVGDKAPAWIGANSELKNQRFRWQIELQPSQKVDVIGELEQAIDSEKTRLWYKILPPPGEFRWIRSEALSSTPPKIRSTTVTLASASKSKSDNANAQPQLAAFQDVIERAPVAGEYIEGEGIVIGSVPGTDQVYEGQVIDEGYVNEGIPSHWNSDDGVIVDESFDGDYIVEDGSIVQGEIIQSEGDACPSCNRMGCTTCGAASHQTDSFQQWDAVEATGNPKLRFRPLGRILGMIGLSVVEGERVPNASGPQCPIGCGCVRCVQNRADLNPRSSGRFNHLPRPVRRIPGHVSSEWLGSNQPIPDSLGGSLASSYGGKDAFPTQSDRSLLAPNVATKDWHGIAPARLGANLGDVGSNMDTSMNERNRHDAERSAVMAASSQAGELHFSHPEIQQAMVELSRVVSESMDRWDLRDHAARAQQWIEQASDPIARGEARLLLERIESFEILRRRSQAAAETAYMPPASGLAVNPNAINSVPASLAGYQRPVGTLDSTTDNHLPFPPTPTAPQRNPDGTPSSDASGWLVQVHSAEFGQPEYALTDDYGGLIAYVQPSPGMNLSRYLKQPVGIYGAKGYLPSLSARQIVAERIVRLR